MNAMADSDSYEILALKYGRHADRTRADNFLFPDDHASPQPIDYFVWVIRNQHRTILLDTGFDRVEAGKRGRHIDHEPRELLKHIDIDADAISDVIISHLHYDHAGTPDHYQGAQFHLQDAEMSYATGRCMCDDVLRRPFSPDHVCQMVKKVYAGRVTFHEGDGAIAPGVTVHAVPGHSRGLQCVRVKTDTGWVVLASDATHLYENFERRRPFPIVVDVEATLKSYTRLEALATSRRHVVPGHDPLVLERYPALSPETCGVIHRLDVARRD
jgi:glyoxylase-like metal-dependent hydrolase (beta-lactamase superfamily II)